MIFFHQNLPFSPQLELRHPLSVHEILKKDNLRIDKYLRRMKIVSRKFSWGWKFFPSKFTIFAADEILE